MRFRNPKNGAVYNVSETHLVAGGFCLNIDYCSSCPIHQKTSRISGVNPCTRWVIKNPHEAARLMGYEFIEEDQDREHIFNLLYSQHKPVPEIVNQVNHLISTDELLRQTAEESSELAQAALKIIRAVKGTTPISEQEAVDRLIEEIADVQNCMSVIFERYPDSKQKIQEISDQKMKRWKERLE